jgi:DNA-directed RNA polymerase alpha subunit
MPPENRRRRNPETFAAAQRDASEILAERMQLPLAESGIEVRIVNGLEKEGITDVATLLKQPRERILSFDNLGEKTMSELIAAVKALDLPVPAGWIPPRKRKKRKRRK